MFPETRAKNLFDKQEHRLMIDDRKPSWGRTGRGETGRLVGGLVETIRRKLVVARR